MGCKVGIFSPGDADEHHFTHAADDGAPFQHGALMTRAVDRERDLALKVWIQAASLHGHLEHRFSPTVPAAWRRGRRRTRGSGQPGEMGGEEADRTGPRYDDAITGACLCGHQSGHRHAHQPRNDGGFGSQPVRHRQDVFRDRTPLADTSAAPPVYLS
ncbi:hypothetical protein CDO25_21610 (plasmid) [Sinorhizobium meliloti]|nr:hypothetical protein CDO25_21610 [Sinorhizobium meliloti]